MQVSKAAVPSDPQYPVYPHYTFGAGEVGWVWQSAADGIGSTGLVLWVDCQAAGEDPRYDKDVADCFVELHSDTAGNANDLLSVSIDNAYPSYWCTVKADLHNVGTVPVKLQSIALTNGLGDVIEYQIQDAAGALGCGYQLDPNEPVDFYLSFHPLNAAAQGTDYNFDMDFTWVNYNEFDPDACQQPGEPTVSGPDTTSYYPGYPAPKPTMAGFRVKGAAGNDVYLGIEDLGIGTNRVEADAGNPLADGTYPLTFAYDATNNAFSLSGPGSVSLSYDLDVMPAPACTAWNALIITLRDNASGEVGLNNVMLGGFPLGNFGPTGVAETPGWQHWTVTGFDFTQSFTVTADLIAAGLDDNESLKAEVTVACMP
jgi:hypothetical protein